MNSSSDFLDWIDTWDKPYAVSLKGSDEAKLIKARSADSAIRGFHAKFPEAILEGRNEIKVCGSGSPIEIIYLATVEKGVIVSMSQTGIQVVQDP